MRSVIPGGALFHLFVVVGVKLLHSKRPHVHPRTGANSGSARSARDEHLMVGIPDYARFMIKSYAGNQVQTVCKPAGVRDIVIAVRVLADKVYAVHIPAADRIYENLD